MIELLLAGLLITQDAAAAPDCGREDTTMAVNACLSDVLERESVRMEAYFAAALERVTLDEAEAGTADAEVDIGADMRQAQSLWRAYADQACGVIYTRWREGSIRNALALQCGIDLTRERTHHLWKAFLTYPDSTPPILPEPVGAAEEP